MNGATLNGEPNHVNDPDSYTPPTDPLKGTVADVCKWGANRAARGDITHDSATQRCSAIISLCTVLTAEEPRTAQYLHDNIDDIARRWATLNPDKSGQTSATYLTRAKGLLYAYLEWAKTPVGYKLAWRKGGPTERRNRRERAPDDTTKLGVDAEELPDANSRPPPPPARTDQPPPPPPPPPRTQPPVLRSLPMGKAKGEFLFQLHDGFEQADLARINDHLATLAPDYDRTKL